MFETQFTSIAGAIAVAVTEEREQHNPEAQSASRLTASHPLAFWDERPRVCCPDEGLAEEMIINVGVFPVKKPKRPQQGIINPLAPGQTTTSERITILPVYYKAQLQTYCRYHPDNLINYLFAFTRTNSGLFIAQQNHQSADGEAELSDFQRIELRRLQDNDLDVFAASLWLRAERLDPKLVRTSLI